MGDPASPTAGDRALRSRLRATFGSVRLVDDGAPEAAGSARVVVIAPSTDPAALGVHYRDATVPLFSLDAESWTAYGLARDPAQGLNGNLLSVVGARPGLAGLPPTIRGTFRLAFGNASLSGVTADSLGAGAVRLATGGGRHDDPSSGGLTAEFAYPFGSVLANDGCATAKRAAFGLGDSVLPRLTGAGWAAFDAALRWLVAAGSRAGGRRRGGGTHRVPPSHRVVAG